MFENGFQMHSPDDEPEGEGREFDIEFDESVIRLTPEHLQGINAFLSSDAMLILQVPTQPVFAIAYALAYLRHNPQFIGVVKDITDEAFAYVAFIVGNVNQHAGDALALIDKSFAEQSAELKE